MKTIVITSPHFIAEEINRLYEIYRLGVQAIHIRKPNASEAELDLFLESLLKVVPASRVAVHAATPLVARRRALTIHLPATMRSFRDRPRSQGRPFSTSAHSLEELKQLGDRYDYMFLSPIFPSISKPGYSKKWDPETLKQTLAECACPVYALGGISPEHLPEVESLGFAGAAIMGAVWQSPTWAGALQTIKSCIDYE